MKNILRNLTKYWPLVLTILALLLVQAYCDLSLPNYTSDLIDVGISNSGIQHSVPEYMTRQGYNEILIFLTEEEREAWLKDFSWDSDNSRYQMTEEAKENWDAVDDQFSSVIAIVYMMTQQQSGGDTTEATEAAQTSSAEMTQQLAMLKETDLASMDWDNLSEEMQAMLTQLQTVRSSVEDKLADLGDTMIVNMAKYFAKSQYQECDIDLDKMQTDYLWATGGKMLAMALLMAACAIAIGFFASRVGAGVGRDLRGKVFRKVMGFSDAEMGQFSTASLITRSTNDVQQIQLVSVIMLRIVLYAPILAIGGIYNVAMYHSGMNWIIILAVAVVICLIFVLMLVAMPKFKKMQELVDHVNLIAREILTGLPVIRAFGREKREEERFEDANKELTDVMLFTNRTMAFMMPIMTIAMNGVSILIVWVAAHRIDEGRLEVGSMTAFLTYAMMIIMGFLMISIVSIMLPRAAVAANRIQELLDSKTLIYEKEHPITDQAEDATVCFSQVDFRYPESEEDALSGIDFVAKPGQTTAIIGSTGCGKSTLVKLIPRFFDVTEGSISIGGKDIRDYSFDTLRGMIGYVPQKGILFSGDITSNIAFGAPNATEEEIKEAATIAQAIDFIEEKDNGFDSPIAQGGSNVSGGQKQRLAIARAIARNPKVYIFDDSFSALDFKTDTALRKALAAKTKNATVLIVAQRVSTILNADQIIVLEEGKMIGKGTHKELVESCETYRQIAQSQLSEEEFAASIAGKEEC